MAKKLHKKYRILLPVLLATLIVGALVLYLLRHPVLVLDPAGEVGMRERKLIIVGVLLSAIVVIPVYIMAILIAVKYRESNTHAKYNPDWDHSKLLESLWWGIPMVIIGVLSVIAWNSSHYLDPYKPLVSSHKPINVQVVAMDWKWLFIYPDQHIASVNLVEMPKNVPVDFTITSDSVMNSFWIPQLGGQIYAMPGMSTQLHLMADKTGSFYGTPANIAGQGFSRMTFTAKSVSQAQFNQWARSVSVSPNVLNASSYSQLSRPSDNYPVTYYSNVNQELYNDVMMKYMPSSSPAMGMSM